jgi:hypothetical protein
MLYNRRLNNRRVQRWERLWGSYTNASCRGGVHVLANSEPYEWIAEYRLPVGSGTAKYCTKLSVAHCQGLRVEALVMVRYGEER